MRPDLRIPVKDYRRGKNLKVQLYQLPYGYRRFWARMKGSRWPATVWRLFRSLAVALPKGDRMNPMVRPGLPARRPAIKIRIAAPAQLLHTRGEGTARPL